MVIGRSILLGIPITLATVGVARWLRRGRTSRRRGLIAVIGGVACLAVAIVAVAASRPQVNPPRLEPSMSVESGVRVRLVVIDGVDWDIANPLISSGDMPNLASLMARGSWGELGIAFPCISPHMWTSLSTGFDDDVHGLCDFFSYRPPGTRALITRFPGGEDRLKRFVFRFLALRLGRWGVGSVVNPARSQKRVPELWDYLTQAGKTTCVAGWKYTYPPSAVNGVMVSDGFGKGYRGGSAVFPENLEEALDERCEQLSPNYMYRLLGRQPVPPPETLSRRARSKIDFIRDEIDRDVCFADLAAYVTDSLAPDFTAVGLYSVDKLEHRFMVERVLASWSDSPQLSGYFRRFTSEEELELFSPSISAAYAVSDSLLGTLIEGAGDDVVIVVSDHGHDQDGSGHRFGPKGVIVMAGGPVVQGARLDEAAVFDITPTVLHLMGLPVPAQMKGRVLTEVLEPSWMEANPVRELDYEGEPAVDTTAGEELEELSEEDIEQLKALGYVQ
jgi:predicted AlkP superfamily phosphohydrolase/phosphomutase